MDKDKCKGGFFKPEANAYCRKVLMLMIRKHQTPSYAPSTPTVPKDKGQGGKMEEEKLEGQAEVQRKKELWYKETVK